MADESKKAPERELGWVFSPDGSRPPPAPELKKLPMGKRLREFLKKALG